ncbi:MAG: hypothetical protein WD801_12235 [Gemmatimonadaceae bacterium]
MTIKSGFLAAALLGAVALIPRTVMAQGPPVWVQDQILSRVQGGVAAGERVRDRGRAGSGRDGRFETGQPVNACAPGIKVAMGTPAGAVLGAIFGAGGPASHARPGCGERDELEIERDDRTDRDDRDDRADTRRGRQQDRGRPTGNRRGNQVP